MDREWTATGRLCTTRVSLPRVKQHAKPSPASQTLLNETVDFLLAAGLSRSAAALELENQRRRVLGRQRRNRLPTEPERRAQKQRRQLIEVSGVVHDWHREEEYTDQEGEPNSLTQDELVALMSRRFSAEKIGPALNWMLNNKVIRRLKDRRLKLVRGRPVLLRGRVKQSQALARAAVVVPQYLRIILRNAATADLNSREVERDARVLFLPEKFVPLWRSLARERAQAFLESMDNWLEDHASSDDVGAVREVSIHVHCYTGDLRDPSAG
jgi:hypothetical protein